MADGDFHIPNSYAKHDVPNLSMWVQCAIFRTYFQLRCWAILLIYGKYHYFLENLPQAETDRIQNTSSIHSHSAILS